MLTVTARVSWSYAMFSDPLLPQPHIEPSRLPGVDRATGTVSLGDDILRVAIADGGKGLSPEVLQRSAEPGHLGLVSVRERFRAMGNQVDMESRPGQGTTVTLVLPLIRRTETTVPSPELPEVRDSAPQKQAVIRVLLVDDHKLMRRELRDILVSDDRIHVVGEAGNGEEALMLAANLVPDVVITDINLPGMNGIEAAKRFKRLHLQMMVFGLSVHTDEQITRDMISAGAETLLLKECATEELTATIVNSYYKRATHP